MTNSDRIADSMRNVGFTMGDTHLVWEALEKQTPKKPQFYSGNYYCPTCGDLVGCHDIIMKWDNKFCKACGQKINWKE